MNHAFKALILALAILAGCAKTIDPVTGVTEARALIAEGKGGEARVLLKNLLAGHPQNATARILLAQILLDEGNAQAASDELSLLDAAALADPVAVQVRARADIGTGKPELALQQLQASGELVPQPDRALLMASAYLALESPADALAVLREVQAKAGVSESVTLGVAGTLAAMGNFELAAAELDSYLAASPVNRADALRMRGDMKLRQGKPDEAAADFRAALEAAPVNWPVINRIATELMIADAQIADGDIAAAKVQLAKIEKSWPGTLGAMVLLGQIDLLEGRHAEAVERLGTAMEAGAGSERIQFLLVEALVKSGNVARANNLLEQLVAAEPESSPTRRVLAAMFMQLGRPDRVIEILGADAELGVNNGVNADDDLLAAARLARSQAARTISVLRGRLAASPGDTNLRAELAAAQLANGEPNAALETLGEFDEARQDPLGIATRLTALYVTGASIKANLVVDRLLNSDAGAGMEVLLAAVDAAFHQQQSAAVSRLLGRAAELAPGSPEVLIRQANLAFAERRYSDATKVLDDLLRREPDNVGAQLALARVAEASGDVEGSRKSLESSVAARPDAMEPSLMLASLELRANNMDAASKVLDRLVAANEKSVTPNVAGKLLASAGRHEEARTLFRQAIDRESDNAEYWFNLGEAQLALRDPAASQQSFLRSADLQPESLRAGFAAVRLSLLQADVISAHRIAQSLVKNLPGSSTSWLLLGEVQAAKGDAPGAAASFAKSYTARANSLSAKREYGARIAAGAPRPEEPLLKWLARQPSDTAVRSLLADFYLVRGRNEAAREHLEIILKQEPNNVAALNNLAWSLRSSAPGRAEALARRALIIAPDNAAVADTLGVILLATGKNDEAVAMLEKAAAAMPEDPTVQYHYASSLSKVGQNGKARGVLGKVLRDQREFPDRAAAQRLFEELG